jgi:protein-disulfide isomerase
MNKDLKRILIIAGTLVAITLVTTMVFRTGKENEEAKRTTELAKDEPDLFVRAYSPRLGPDDAPVTIVEFFDPECEACRAVYPMVKSVMSQFEGKVRLVLRYMPLHGNARYAASVLEAARLQGRYWDMLETLLLHQPKWGSHHHPRPELIPGYAEAIGLDMAALNSAVESGQFDERITTDHNDGTALGVRQTPVFFVNGRRLARLGEGPLIEMIQSELAKATR